MREGEFIIIDLETKEAITDKYYNVMTFITEDKAIEFCRNSDFNDVWICELKENFCQYRY